MIKVASGDDAVIKEVLLRRITKMSQELAGPNPSPLERILCERVAITWFDANEMDRRYIDQNNISLQVANYREARRDRAHKRFLAACKTLATVRRLGVPNLLQVNVAAKQQVNVSAPVG
jgi:hypothetical protein